MATDHGGYDLLSVVIDYFAVTSQRVAHIAGGADLVRPIEDNEIYCFVIRLIILNKYVLCDY